MRAADAGRQTEGAADERAALADISRRGLLAGGGALIVSFSLLPAAGSRRMRGDAAAQLPGSLAAPTAGFLDAHRRPGHGHRLYRQGRIRPGHEDGDDPARGRRARSSIRRRSSSSPAIPALTPNEGYTAGSQSHAGQRHRDSHGGGADARDPDRRGSDEARRRRRTQLSWKTARSCAPDGAEHRLRRVGRRRGAACEAAAAIQAEGPEELTPLVGMPIAARRYPREGHRRRGLVQDLRLPGMVHARVVRPPSYGAQLRSVDAAQVEKMPGVLKVVRDGSYLAVIAEHEFQAITAMHALARSGAMGRAAEAARLIRRCLRMAADHAGADITVILDSRDHARARHAHASRRTITGRIRCTVRSARPAPSACSRTAS